MNSPKSDSRQSDTTEPVKSSDGFFDVAEGSIYWRFDEKNDGEVNDRPTLVLIHSGLADHTMWDEQVTFLVDKGWNCLRFDVFGYGKSRPNENYLQNPSREAVDVVEQLEQLRQRLLGPGSKIIGLSVGSGLALEYTLAHSQNVAGLVLIACGLEGFEHTNTDPQEEELFNHSEGLATNGDFHGVANLIVRIYGDGPKSEPGRLKDEIADRMLEWSKDIAVREYNKTGGSAIDTVHQDPPAIARLHTLQIPTAVAWGTFDDSYTTAAMKYVASQIAGSTSKEFNTAHMINLEQPNEVNQWLSDWLDASFEV